MIILVFVSLWAMRPSTVPFRQVETLNRFLIKYLRHVFGRFELDEYFKFKDKQREFSVSM